MCQVSLLLIYFLQRSTNLTKRPISFPITQAQGYFLKFQHMLKDNKLDLISMRTWWIVHCTETASLCQSFQVLNRGYSNFVMTFISSSEVKKYIFHEWRRWNKSYSWFFFFFFFFFFFSSSFYYIQRIKFSAYCFNVARYMGLRGHPEFYYRHYVCLFCFFNTEVLLFIFSIKKSSFEIKWEFAEFQILKKKKWDYCNVTMTSY